MAAQISSTSSTSLLQNIEQAKIRTINVRNIMKRDFVNIYVHFPEKKGFFTSGNHRSILKYNKQNKTFTVTEVTSNNVIPHPSIGALGEKYRFTINSGKNASYNSDTNRVVIMSGDDTVNVEMWPCTTYDAPYYCDNISAKDLLDWIHIKSGVISSEAAKLISELKGGSRKTRSSKKRNSKNSRKIKRKISKTITNKRSYKHKSRNNKKKTNKNTIKKIFIKLKTRP